MRILHRRERFKSAYVYVSPDVGFGHKAQSPLAYIDV